MIERNFQELTWHELEQEDDGLEGAKTFLLILVQEEEPKKASVQGLEGRKFKQLQEGTLQVTAGTSPTGRGRVLP